jgi:Mg2+-importing ATPase
MATEVLALSRLEPEPSCTHLGSTLGGLTDEEAARRLKVYGPNLVTRERRPTILQELWGRARNPLNALLVILATVSWFLGDVRAAIVIAVMVVLSVATSFIQEHRSNEAAARLRSMVRTTAAVSGALATRPVHSLRFRSRRWCPAISSTCPPAT